MAEITNRFEMSTVNEAHRFFQKCRWNHQDDDVGIAHGFVYIVRKTNSVGIEQYIAQVIGIVFVPNHELYRFMATHIPIDRPNIVQQDFCQSRSPAPTPYNGNF
jgi:hypothetical protein